MDVGPREVYEKQFSDAWRGYNQEEVDDFLDKVAEALDATMRENADLAERVRTLEDSVATAREAEEMLRTTLATAQQAAEEAMAKAKSKAEQLVADAQQLVTEAEERSRRSEEEAQERISSLEADLRRRAREAERDQEKRKQDLEASIERLTTFEAELKQRLAEFLGRQQQTLESLSGPPPSVADSEEAGAEREQPFDGEEPRVVIVAEPPEAARVSEAGAEDAATSEQDVFVDSEFPDFQPGEDEQLEPEYEHQRRGLRSLFHRDEE